MPFGDLEIDTELAEALMNHFPDVRDDAEAHQQEHSLETQLPFLHYFQKDFKFVPVCLQRLSLDDVAQLATAVVKAIRAVNKPVLLVASSDMTHYESHQSASQKDRMAIERNFGTGPRGTLRNGDVQPDQHVRHHSGDDLVDGMPGAGGEPR